MKAPARKTWPRSGSVISVLCLVLLFFSHTGLAQTNPAPTSPPPGAPVLTTGRQVQLLSREEAASKLRAVLRGVVTCYLPDSDSLVIQDATRGVYVSQIRAAYPDAPRVGDLFEIEGVTDPGQFAPQLLARKVTRLGTGELPTPAQPTWDQLINGSFDTQFVEIHGIVTAVGPDSVTLLTHAGKIVARLYGTNYVASGTALMRYKDSKIRVRGCMFAMWDARTHQVRVGEISMQVAEIFVDEPAPADVFDLPRRHASELWLFDPEASLLRRVLVSGQIVQERKGQFFAMDGSEGFRFIPTDPVTFAVGDIVDVVGFASLTGPSPVLLEAVVRKTGSASLPEATPVDPENLFNAKLDSTRVRVEAVLRGISADQSILELQSGLVGFLSRIDVPEALATTNLPNADSADKFSAPLGCQLALTGVYVGHGGNFSDGGQIGSFELLLISAADIVVLARPPFWNLPRLLALIGSLGVVLLLALFWIRLLHHKIVARTAELEIEVRERQQAEQQRALAIERSRIARDLHDDLGSSLTEITLFATASPGQSVGTEEAAERLENIAGRSRAMVHALDEIVWAVDPERDTLASVARYLASYAEEYLAGLKVACRVQIPPSFPERVISGETRHELFLAVKEALNNAVRHGRATEIGFRARLLESHLEIILSDNGSGFATADPSEGRGLPNLRARLQNLRGTVEIQSSPGGGTIVSMRLPLGSSNSNS